MMTQRPLSACPECGTELRERDLLIEYEHSSTGRTGYAECPECERVVKVPL
jgi:endogenous inhibitor of DNA gyrase (YacG/DUF329 family)